MSEEKKEPQAETPETEAETPDQAPQAESQAPTGEAESPERDEKKPRKKKEKEKYTFTREQVEQMEHFFQESTIHNLEKLVCFLQKGDFPQNKPSGR